MEICCDIKGMILLENANHQEVMRYRLAVQNILFKKCELALISLW